MSLETAHALWGPEAVALALAEAEPDEATGDLAREVVRRADPPGAFAAWALAQPWPRFCAVVRIVSGEVRRDVERAAKEERDDEK